MNQALWPDNAHRTGNSLPMNPTLQSDKLAKAANCLPVNKTSRPDSLFSDWWQPSRRGRTVSPGLQGKAGSRTERESLPFAFGWSPEDKFLWSASTAPKRWRLFRFLFGRSKRNAPPVRRTKQVSSPALSNTNRKKTKNHPSRVGCQSIPQTGRLYCIRFL